jgi:ribosome-associated heat shock protein Hsp15
MNDSVVAVRIDKWLWAARFYKTRSAATDAVAGGKIEVNGERAKPSRLVRPGDEVSIRQSPYHFVVDVTATGERRGSVAAAQALYRETDASRTTRERLAEQLRLAPKPVFTTGRPGKKERRELGRLRRKD